METEMEMEMSNTGLGSILYGQPCRDLLEGRRGRDYLDICVPLQNALKIGEWEKAKNILDNFHVGDLLGYGISMANETALHIAVTSTNIKIMKHLVDRMTEHQLALQDQYGSTALFYVAGAGNVDIARLMIQKCPLLLKIRNFMNRLPIHVAAIQIKRNMVAFLYGEYKNMEASDWGDEDKHELFLRCIEVDLFDCARKILDDNDQRGFPQQMYAWDALYRLARNSYAFKDTEAGWKITWVQGTKTESVATNLLRKIWKNILERSIDEINLILKGPMVPKDDKETYPFQIPYVAAETGNARFLVELIRGYPDITFMVNDDQQTIYHTATSYRHESIFSLLYEMGSMHDIMSYLKDKDNNNMLHLVGMKAKGPLNVSGAAFQMQRELLWFEEVKSKVLYRCREEKNINGYTPLELFIKNHQDMVSEGERWMKEIANQCMVVATLITTIVFSAAFTIPGGYDQDNGLPIFLKDGPFIAFVILDATSLILSSASILIFLSILTSRYVPEDFRISLPKKLMIGLITLFLSIITMMVAFTLSFFVLYRNKLISIPITISIAALVPVFLYMKLQFPLMMDVYRATYGSTCLFKPKKRVLYYRHPRF